MSSKMSVFHPLTIFFLSTVSVVLGGKSPHADEIRELLGGLYASYPDDVIQDSQLDVVGLLTKYSYAAETHEVETEDGYLLTLHRIPGRKDETLENSKPVVFLMHGLVSSSADWISAGPHNDALGYVLANEGYDVWMGNARGNYYSRKHKSMDPEQSAFWKFSWNEIGLYDLPAMIDYALKVTEQDKLHYIGHSQGTTTFFVLMSERPEYNKKIKLMQAFAPAVYMTNAKNPYIRMVEYSNNNYTRMMLVGENELVMDKRLYGLTGKLICNSGFLIPALCGNAVFLAAGFNRELFNATLLPIVLGHLPAGASFGQLLHYSQVFKSGKFRKFDFGRKENLLQYSQETPPDYRLGSITAPVAVYYGEDDWLVDSMDVKRFYKELINPIEIFRVPHPTFSHLDFLFATNVKYLLYDHVIEVMKKYNY